MPDNDSEVLHSDSECGTVLSSTSGHGIYSMGTIIYYNLSDVTIIYYNLL
jgi:hypothetical protein